MGLLLYHGWCEVGARWGGFGRGPDLEDLGQLHFVGVVNCDARLRRPGLPRVRIVRELCSLSFGRSVGGGQAAHSAPQTTANC